MLTKKENPPNFPSRILTGLLFLILSSCGQQAPKVEFQLAAETEDQAFSQTIDGVFDIPELRITPSPDHACRLDFQAQEKVVDYDISPAGGKVAIATKDSGGGRIQFWVPGDSSVSESCPLPAGFVCKAISWHPTGKSIFVMGIIGNEHQILRLDPTPRQWLSKRIFESKATLRRLVACPRPFITGYDPKRKATCYEYRVFFGMDNGDNSYRVVSVTEFGNRFYQVIGPKKTQTSPDEIEAELQPSEINAEWALPLAFHPAGHELIWEDPNNRFGVASYASRAWGSSAPLTFPMNGGTITPTPNGIGFLHWKKDSPGIGVFLLPNRKEEKQLTGYQFIATPSSVPDGKGIVGLTRANDSYSLHYLPITVPLANVMNAWMFVKTPGELAHFTSHSGLFRPNKGEQLYSLYETENYYCNGYDQTAPTRPYLVTTDIFWELFGAAYQGLLIVKERSQAIPAFWQFVKQAGACFAGKESKWAKAFDVLSDLASGKNPDRPEIRYISECTNAVSETTGKTFRFSNLKPRGHYTSTPEMSTYFKAFKYLTTILADDADALNELKQLPPDIARLANEWIKCYGGFIAPSRYPSVWDKNRTDAPAYCQYPKKDPVLFPLSWGFDNEILNSVVYHRDYPPEWQVEGPAGPRLIPSGLDLASVLGNRFAENLLSSDLEKYPPLKKVIDHLKRIYEDTNNKPVIKDNLYNRWINSMAIQWADTVRSINGNTDYALWQTKRLQTGLATWATLRHATVLVNEKGAAECGEGGFEEILMRAPRGAVEADPYTFESIARLFEQAVNDVPDAIHDQEDQSEPYRTNTRSLYDGIVSRLNEAATEAREFAKMARKERDGMALSNTENEKILYVARSAEHLFLIFNSLSNTDYALSVPDPMPKITDVFGDGAISPYLMAAVGNASEWNYIVPFYGRRQMVKGAVYSYYEFESNALQNDEEWRKKVDQQEFVSWLKPFICTDPAEGMAETGY